MTAEQKVAYVNAQTAAMLAELEGMKVTNLERQMADQAMAYGEDKFRELPDQYGLRHNQILKLFYDE
jgi:hypothetical protein